MALRSDEQQPAQNSILSRDRINVCASALVIRLTAIGGSLTAGNRMEPRTGGLRDAGAAPFPVEAAAVRTWDFFPKGCASIRGASHRNDQGYCERNPQVEIPGFRGQ
jgi:hypothetical protein